jgi:lipopolysaccharide transport system permease protein
MPATEASPTIRSDSGNRAWRTIRPSGRWPRLQLGELWAYRHLAFALAQRDLQLRYRQTLFGVAWAVIQPLAAMAIFTLFLGDLAGVPSEGLPYAVFVLAGLVIWTFLSSAVAAAAETLVEYRDLVTKVWFPRMLAPIAAVTTLLVDLAIGLVIFGAAIALYGVGVPLEILTLPLWLFAAVALAIAVGLWLSAANVLYRDVRYTLGFALQLWLYASPVVFPSSIVEGAGGLVFHLNPAAGVIDGFRWATLGIEIEPAEIALSAASLLILLISGAVYFSHAERAFADRI